MGDVDDPEGLTRRGLLWALGGATVAAGAVGCKPSKERGLAPVEPAPEPGPGGGDVPATASELRFTLNGQPATLTVEPRTTLAEALRLDAGLTGTKVSCDRGACGACTVQVGGRARNSCMMLAHDVGGREVLTVEGLASGDTLSPLQRAFVARDAAQCGFCTSGMLMSCAALLEREKHRAGKLGADEVRQAIAGNLCRCGTYPHVIEAVLEVDRDRAQGGAG